MIMDSESYARHYHDMARLAELQKDHDAMAHMFFQPPPPLSQILEILRAFEARIQSLPA